MEPAAFRGGLHLRFDYRILIHYKQKRIAYPHKKAERRYMRSALIFFQYYPVYQKLFWFSKMTTSYAVKETGPE